MTTRQSIDEFLALKRIAVVGVSRSSQDFTRTMFREFARRAYDVVPVNPAMGDVEGRTVYPRVQDIEPGVEGALVMTPPSMTERVVRDCEEAGIRRVWMYRAGGAGAVSPEAVKFCEAHGIQVIEGHCPFMFFPNTAFFHRLHGFVLRIAGRYPR